MELSQSAPFDYPVLMIASADHVTGKVGLTLAVQLAKAGGPFAPITPVMTERGFGWYTVRLTSADTDTLGALALHITGVSADPFDSLDEIVSAASEALPAIPSSWKMLVPLSVVKSVLRIPMTDTTMDAQLLRLILAASSWVGKFTHHNFGTPTRRVEYHEGYGQCEIVLDGHLDDSDEANINPSETLDPLFSLKIDSRPWQGTPADWTSLVEGTDWERRDDTIRYLGAWGVWPFGTEFRFTYLDGYLVAPADLQQVVIELVINQYAVEKAISQTGGAGVTAEKLGDFSYSRDLHAIGAGGYNALSDLSRQTLMHYKRMIA